MGRSKVITWIDNLKNRGITEFKFSMLPEDLKDLSTFKRAISQEKIVKVINNRQYGSFWRIKT